MGEHKRNPLAIWIKKHPKARFIPTFLSSRPKNKQQPLPEGRYIIKNPDPFSCPDCGEPLPILEEEEDEEDDGDY